MASYAGLAIGDVLEIDSETQNAEHVVIRRFASVHLVSATRHLHRRGATVRRLVEGTGLRHEQVIGEDEQRRGHRAASPRAEATMSTGCDPDLERFESHESWSPR